MDGIDGLPNMTPLQRTEAPDDVFMACLKDLDGVYHGIAFRTSDGTAMQAIGDRDTITKIRQELVRLLAPRTVYILKYVRSEDVSNSFPLIDNDYYKGKIDVFNCVMGHCTITKDRDGGLHARTINCPLVVLDGKPCGLPSTSQGYQVDQKLVPQYLWIKPSAEEFVIMTKGMDEKNIEYLNFHIQSGGLLLTKLETGNQ